MCARRDRTIKFCMLPCAGDRPKGAWYQYAEQDAVTLVAAYEMTNAWQGCMRCWMTQNQRGPEALKVMQQSWAGLDRMRPMLANALHTMQPSQLRKQPLQAQRAVSEALRNLAATCNITAWTHARRLASQVAILILSHSKTPLPSGIPNCSNRLLSSLLGFALYLVI